MVGNTQFKLAFWTVLGALCIAFSAQAPGARGCLPSPDRRLLVQADAGGHLRTRVYDRANLPDCLREILRLAGCRVQAWVPQFTAESRIDSCGVEFGGFLALSPDRQQILYALANRPLQFWDPTTHEFLAEIRALPAMGSIRGGIAYSPDVSQAAIIGDYSEGFCLETKTWKVLIKFHEPRTDGGYYTPRWPVFTADGRHLLLQYDHDLVIFDTATWQRVDQLPEVPQGALQFIPAPDHKRAVVTLKTGAIVLWDVPHRRSIATLAQNARLSQVSFSPDGSRVATVTEGTNDFSATAHSLRLRIWKSRNGRHETEIGLDGQTAWPDNFEHLLWSPDGEYLLAVAHVPGGSSGVDIFNVKTGRYGGYFSGPMGEMNGLILLPGGSQLVGGGNDGKIYFWDFKAAMNIIKPLEHSQGN